MGPTDDDGYARDPGDPGDPGDNVDPDDPDDPGDPGDETRPDRVAGRAGRGVGALVAVVVGIAVVAGILYGSLYALAHDRVPRNTRVAGVDVGGLTLPAARTRLTAALTPAAAGPIQLAGGGVRGSLVPARSGLRYDIEASAARVDPVTSRNPVDLVQGLLARSARYDPVVHVDGARLDAALATVAKGYDRPVREASVTLTGGVRRVTAPLPGRRVDRAASAPAVVAAFTGRRDSAELTVTSVTARTTAAGVAAALAGPVPKVLVGPVSLTAGGRSVQFGADRLAAAVSFGAGGPAGGLVPKVDVGALRGGDPSVSSLQTLQTPPVDAGFTLSGSTPVLRPAADGLTLPDAAVAAAVGRAATATGNGRTVAVPLVRTGPRVTTAQVQALGVTATVGQFTVRYAPDGGLAANLSRAAGLIQGTVVGPGATVSLNRMLGDRTAARGWAPGPELTGGRYTQGVGGGVGTAATALYDAAYLAGWKVVQHTPASVYTGSGPPGRDATIAYPGIDLVLRNDTPTPAWLYAVNTAGTGTLTVAVLGRPWWTVTASASARSRVVQPSRVSDPGPACTPRPGSPGFRITDRRTTRHGGAPAGHYIWITTYRAAPTVVCSAGPPPGTGRR